MMGVIHMSDYHGLSKEQKKSLILLRKAFTKCTKIGIGFFDNYGSFTAYNSKAITKPFPDHFHSKLNAVEVDDDWLEWIEQAGRVGGNADDPLSCELLVTLDPQHKEPTKGSE